ncbi:MAG: sulfatase-like hydrolase/transferase, partial [Pirellulales bacterium]|nr:sulfatase-like hydrolase/transferase [Pirellulales bacterium]
GLFTAGDRRLELTYPFDCHGRPVTAYLGWVFQTDEGELFSERGVGLAPDMSRKLADAAIRFLRAESGRPFFLHVNFLAPHDPLLIPPGYEDKYDWRKIPLPENFLPEHPFDHGNLDGRDEKLLPHPRTEEDVRRDLAAYYAVISDMDAQLGRILAALDELGEAERTIVIFTSDHGLAIGSHGLRGKQNMYDHTVGVPLIMRGPGVPERRRSKAQCYLRDLFPTICDLTGIDVPEAVEGRSLAPVIRGQREELYAYVFGHYRDVQRMVRSDRWKLIRYPRIDRWQLFDLQNDPHELHDLIGKYEYAEVVSRLKGALSRWRREVNDPLSVE